MPTIGTGFLYNVMKLKNYLTTVEKVSSYHLKLVDSVEMCFPFGSDPGKNTEVQKILYMKQSCQ